MIVRPILCRPFIGRQQELAYLRERRLEAGRSHGSFLLVAGDAGVGKSRLIAEFCKSLTYSRWKLGRGACLEFASRPYGPILEALARVDSSRLELGAAETKREQFDAIVARFAAVAARSALILIAEDLHWADVATLDFLEYFGAKLHNMRVLIVASVRGDELHPDNPAAAHIAKIGRAARAGRIELGPLKGPELQRFIDEALAGVELSSEVRRDIAIAGDGNPFYTEELLKSAVERDREGGNAPEAAKLPQSVRTTLLERLRPFDESERRVVAQAAVIGRTFGLDLLAATLETNPAQLLPALRRARDFQLVEELAPQVFRFRHGLTRDAFYSEFLGAELQLRHRAIALALENAAPNGSVEALAYHWWAAREPAKALHYNELAGDAAARVYAHEDAIGFYERALEFDLKARARGEIVKKIADHRVALGSTKEAQPIYAAAADIFREAGEHEREAACRVAAALTAYGIGLPHPTRPLETMLTRLDQSEYLARSRVHLGLAWLAATFAFPTRARHHLEQVDPRALAQVPDNAQRFHNVAAFVAMQLGDLDTFRSEHAAWVAASEARGAISSVATAYINGAMCRSFFGLHEEAQRDLERALAFVRRTRNSEESVHAFGAMCALLRGDLETARAELGEVSPASENGVNVTFATAWGTVIGAALDDPVLIERWFDGFEAAIAGAPEIECGAGFAEIMVRRGRSEEAARFLHRALPECEMVRGNIITLLAVGRYGAPEDRERARQYLERAAAGELEMPERPALALFNAMACRRDGHTDDAQRLARDAADGFRRLGFPLLAAQALEIAGDDAEALQLFRRCGATYDIRRLERRQRNQRGERDERWEQAETRGASLLSAREREIAVLAVSGRTNLEIANQLSITHKTVEKHLGSVYQKLQISSRAQLGAYVEVKDG